LVADAGVGSRLACSGPADLLSGAQRGLRDEECPRLKTKDSASGHVGHVLGFEVDAAFLEQCQPHRVGGAGIDELWIPAERVEAERPLGVEVSDRLLDDAQAGLVDHSPDHVGPGRRGDHDLAADLVEVRDPSPTSHMAS
jgi:hypothetical protein